MAQQVLSGVDELRRSFKGKVVTPSDKSYDQDRRAWNGDIDRRPALIALCTDTEDVKTALAFGRKSGLPLAIRSGGHSFPGHSVVDDGIVIDLRGLNEVHVDASKKTVTVGGGAVWAEVDGATLPHGLCVTGGHVSHTGVAGLTLGGGFGHLHRNFGLSSDNLLAAKIVTAEGNVLNVSAGENKDLFWGIRGGGGNFGIATEFQFRLHPMPELVFGGLAFWAPDRGPELMRRYNELCKDMPDVLNTIFGYLHAPPMPFVPEAVQLKPGYVVVAVSTDIPVAEQAMKSLREFGPPLFDIIGPMPYHVVQTMFDPANPPGTKAYLKSHYIKEYSPDVIEVIHAHTGKMPPGHSQMLNIQLGGAIAKVGEDETSFGGRSAGFLPMLTGEWEDDADKPAAVEWARAFSKALEPHAEGGMYVNLSDNQSEAQLQVSYGRAKYERLAGLKATYDPENVFRLNQNIKPKK